MTLCKYGGRFIIWYFRKMDSLAGQQLVKADGASVNADEALANKVYFPFRQDQVFFLTRSVCFLSNKICLFSF